MSGRRRLNRVARSLPAICFRCALVSFSDGGGGGSYDFELADGWEGGGGGGAGSAGGGPGGGGGGGVGDRKRSNRGSLSKTSRNCHLCSVYSS